MKSTVNNHLRRAAMMLLATLFTTMTASAVTVDEGQVTFLTAIRSTGAQAFNTGYTHKANTRVELDCEVTKNNLSNWEALFGGRLGNMKRNAFCFFSRHWNQTSTAEDNPCFNRTGQEMNGTGFVYGERIKLVCEGQTATWYKYSAPTTVVGSINTTGTADDGKTPMFLFNLNTSSTVGGTQEDTSPSVMTLYGCKIYEGTTLKCDFVPVRYNGEVGLYDRVNRTFGGSITSTVFQEVDDYDRALIAIHDGQSYRIFTVVNGQKYYVTADGKLSTSVSEAPLFKFTKIKGEEYEYGFQLKNGDTYFTNPKTEYEAALTQGQLNTMNSTPRNTWEAQVFFLNSNGKYAVRSTNAKSGPSGWDSVGRAFWTVNEGPKAEYSRNINYVWQLESEIDLNGQELLTNGQCDGTYNGWTRTDGGSGWGIANENGTYCWVSSYQVCTLSQTVTLSDFSISETDIDNGKVTCAASAVMKAPLRKETKPQGATVNKVYVEMIGASNNVLGTITLIDDTKIYQDWTSLRTEGFQLASGTRRLKYVVRGQDACFWTGQYGPCYRNLSLKASVEAGSAIVEYPVWLGGTQVTSENMDDVLGDGTVSYTPGNGTGTLTIMGKTPNLPTNISSFIRAYEIDLTIDAPKGLDLSRFKSLECGISVMEGSLTINGDVNMELPYGAIQGIYAENVSISGNVIISGGNNGIFATDSVTMLSGQWKVSGNNDAITASSLTIPDTHRIVEPADGTFSDGTIVNANGYKVNSAIIVEASADAYIITVRGGKAYEEEGWVFSFGRTQIYTADAGMQVFVEPDVVMGQYVLSWNSDVSVNFEKNGSYAVFTMPESNVTLTPVSANQYPYNIDVRQGNEATVDGDVYNALLDTYKPNNLHGSMEKLDLDGDGTQDLQLTFDISNALTFKAKALEGTNLTGSYSVTEPNLYKYYPINVVFSGAGLPTWAGSGTEDNPYIISSASELDQLAQYVKGIEGMPSNTFTGKYFKLGCDITYTHNSDWNDATSKEDNYTPIGFQHNYDKYVFNGHFDGDGHTVSGIRIHKDELYSCLGLFGLIGSDAEVKNVILDDARITGYYNFGGIVGCSSGSVSNCHVTATVTIHSGWEYARNVGGIVGLNGDPSHNGVVTDCSCAATLTLADGIEKNTCYGGIVGMNYNGILRRNIVAGATIPVTRYESVYNGYTYGTIIGYKYGYTALEHNYYRDCTVAGTANANNVGIGNLGDHGAADDENNDGAVPQHKGDVDLDGEAKSIDVTAAVEQLLGIRRNRLTEVAADLNNNGQVDIEDVTRLIDAQQ